MIGTTFVNCGELLWNEFVIDWLKDDWLIDELELLELRRRADLLVSLMGWFGAFSDGSVVVGFILKRLLGALWEVMLLRTDYSKKKTKSVLLKCTETRKGCYSLC